MIAPIERNEAFRRALELMGSSTPFLFITGRAGTGKSTLLRTFCEESSLVCPILAPTGVAALNVGGETIHRFFRFSPGITMKEARKRGLARQKDPLLKTIDGFVIDEISMVRADLLDCVDVFLRAALNVSSPFGGKRIIAIGDLAQLPPVIRYQEREAFAKMYETPYFFSSRAVQTLLETQNMHWQELETVYRQTDPAFIKILNAIRDRVTTSQDLIALNQRVQPNNHPPSEQKSDIVLTTTNDQADMINQKQLEALDVSSRTYAATIVGDFHEKDAPTDTNLTLKKGARVMCVANESGGAYVNGTMGTVVNVQEKEATISLDTGAQITLTPHTWTLFQSRFDEVSKNLVQEKLGSFTQIPLRLAWAITIHKSQGKTFDRLILDLERGAFAHGQVYVALSRSRTLEGITLTKPVRAHHLHIDEAVNTFMLCLRAGGVFKTVGQSALL